MSVPESSSTSETQAALPAPPLPSQVRGAMRGVSFRLSASVPLAGLKLRGLCALKIGQMFVTTVSAAEDVPVRVGGALLGYAELDNVDGQMAVRLTQLS